MSSERRMAIEDVPVPTRDDPFQAEGVEVQARPSGEEFGVRFDRARSRVQARSRLCARPSSDNTEKELGVRFGLSSDNTEKESPLPAPQAQDAETVHRPVQADEEVGRSMRMSDVGGASDNVVNRLSDHFSLEMPSSSVRSRRARVRVYEQANSQFILEERTRRTPTAAGEEGATTEVKVKYTNNATTALKVLRATYSLMTLFAGGFLLIFCIMLLLFLFLDLVSRSGLTSSLGMSILGFISVLLSVPVFVFGLSFGLAISWTFVKDTWHGHIFLRTFGNWSVVITEWWSFSIYLGIPLVTMIISLFAKQDDWWTIALLTWFACILIFFGFFAACVVYYDFSACLYLVQSLDDPWYGPVRSGPLVDLMRRAILLRQVDRFSGTKHLCYTIGGKLDELTLRDESMQDHEPTSERVGLYSRMTLWGCCQCLFHKLDPPQRNFTVEEACGVTPFVTGQSWSLEKIYCRRQHESRTVAVISGPSALTPQQFQSSFACSILGTVLSIVLPVALLVWLEAGAGLIVLISLLIIICCLPSLLMSYRIQQRYKESLEHAGEEGEETEESGTRRKSVASEAIYQVWELFRVTRPNPSFCYAVFAFEVVFLFLWPLVYLFASGNFPMGILFLFVGFFSGIHHYFNAAIVLKELGSFGSLGDSSVVGANLTPEDLMDTKTDKQWKAKSRLTSIVRNVSRGQSRSVFAWFFGVIMIILIVTILAAFGSNNRAGGSEEESKTVEILPDFEYEPQPNLPYQTCQFGKGLEIPGAEASALIDYAFLSAIAYNNENDTQYFLDQWFGNGFAMNSYDVVNKFRASSEEYDDSAVHYKFITFTENPSFAVITIRGTVNVWDFLTDCQLWGAAALFQGLRVFLPLGDIFTPMLHKVVKFVSALETESINRVSYYREISAFIEWLRSTLGYENLHVSGHSLGGGLALISGSQTETPAVGISAPNAMLSRETFDPPITPLQLNTYTFNVIPNRDLIPRVDDVADLYQRIECRAPANDNGACHSSIRSLCEIMYTCGTGKRPAACVCAQKYGYRQPTPTGNRTFEQACASSQS